jgi:hypothetical protein
VSNPQTVSQPTQQQQPTINSSRPVSISINNPAPAPVSPTLPEVSVVTPKQSEVFKNEPVTEKDLETAWKAFAATIPDEVRMVIFINENKPKIISENLFEITVVNQLLEKELERLKPDILTFLYARLNNEKLQMSIKIAAENETTRSISPEERYAVWAEENRALEKLRQGLNMEID